MEVRALARIEGDHVDTPIDLEQIKAQRDEGMSFRRVRQASWLRTKHAHTT